MDDVRPALVGAVCSKLTFRLGAKKQSTTVAASRNIIASVADVGVMLLDGKLVLKSALAREINYDTIPGQIASRHSQIAMTPLS